MGKRLQGLVIGILIGALLTGGITFATTQYLSAEYNNIKLVVDGKEVVPKDATGNVVEPFIVNGTTYLPVRAVAGAFGKAVNWDGPSYTVYLGDMDGKLKYPTLKTEDAINIGGSIYNSSKIDKTDNYENSYSSARPAHDFETLLNMKYSKFKGTLYVKKGYSQGGIYKITITVDGKTVYTSPEITKSSKPIPLDINVTGGNDFIISAESQNAGVAEFPIGIGDAGFYQ